MFFLHLDHHASIGEELHQQGLVSQDILLDRIQDCAIPSPLAGWQGHLYSHHLADKLLLPS